MIRRSFALLAGALVAVAAAATRTRIYAAFSTGGIYEMLFAPTAPIRSQFVQAKSQVCPQKPQFGLHVARLAPGADGTIFVSGGSPQGNDDDDNDDGGGVGVGTIFSTGLDEQSTCNVFANVTGTVYGVGDMVPDGGGGLLVGGNMAANNVYHFDAGGQQVASWVWSAEAPTITNVLGVAMHQDYVYWLGYFAPHAVARAKIGAATAAELFIPATQQQGGADRCSRLLVSARGTLLVFCYSSTVIEEYSLTGANGKLLHAHPMPTVVVDGHTPSGIELFSYNEQADAYVAGLFHEGKHLLAGGWLLDNFTKLDITLSRGSAIMLGGIPTAFMTVAVEDGGGGGAGGGSGGGTGTSSSGRSTSVSLGVGLGIGLFALLAAAFAFTRRGQPYGRSRTMLSSVTSFGVHRDAAGSGPVGAVRGGTGNSPSALEQQPSAERTTNPVTAQVESVRIEMAGAQRSAEGECGASDAPVPLVSQQGTVAVFCTQCGARFADETQSFCTACGTARIQSS
eukprot:g121.t1